MGNCVVLVLLIKENLEKENYVLKYPCVFCFRLPRRIYERRAESKIGTKRSQSSGKKTFFLVPRAEYIRVIECYFNDYSLLLAILNYIRLLVSISILLLHKHKRFVCTELYDLGQVKK